MEKFYMVLNENTNYTSMKHTSLESAKKEAERLARKEKGIGFYVLCAIGKATIEPEPVKWQELIDYIPY